MSSTKPPFIIGPGIYQQLALLNALLFLPNDNDGKQELQHLTLDDRRIITLFRGQRDSRFAFVYRFDRSHVVSVESEVKEDGLARILIRTRPDAIQSMTFDPEAGQDHGYSGGTCDSMGLHIPAQRLPQIERALKYLISSPGSGWFAELPPLWT